jgi:S-adenosylmethionine:tRNA ribosyltransferase-isomerase
VGTTVVRVLETFGKTNLTEGQTEIFIHPPFDFCVTDFMITNFHLPNSSLMMLVEAFLQNKKSKRHLKDLYEIAISEKMKFYSFGDAMLII